MATPKGLSANLEDLGVKTHSLRKAILTLALKWKDLDGHLDPTSSLFGKSLANLESKQRDLNCVRESIVESNRELDSIRESLQLKLEELECEKEKFCDIQQKQIEEFMAKEEQLSALLRVVEERSKEVGSREETLGGQMKLTEELFWKIEMEKIEFLRIQKSVGEMLNLNILKEQSFKEQSSELDRRAKHLDSKKENFKLIQDLNAKRCEELNIKAQELDRRTKDFDSREENFKLIQDLNAKRLEELNIKAQELDRRAKDLDSREEKMNSAKEKRLAIQNSPVQTPSQSHPPTELTTTPVTLIISSPESSPSTHRASYDHRESRTKRKRMPRSMKTASSHPATSSNPCPIPYLPSPLLLLSDNDDSN